MLFYLMVKSLAAPREYYSHHTSLGIKDNCVSKPTPCMNFVYVTKHSMVVGVMYIIIMSVKCQPEIRIEPLRGGISDEQVQYFISKIQPGLRRSNPLESSPGSHSLLVSNSVRTTSSSLLVFPLSVSFASSRLRCLSFSVSISNS